MRNAFLIGGTTVAAAVLAAAASATPAQAGAGQTFRANLTALNAGSHTVTTDAGTTTYSIPSASGTAVINVTGDDVTVTINAAGLTPRTLHPQHIHAGTTCPSAADDANGDGFVDVIEGLPKYGPILISLDRTLNSQAASLDFPVSDASGAYHYSQSASKSHLQSELKQALNLGSRHVVIHGIDPTDPLPASVQSLPGLPAWATLPVACGQLHLVK